MQQVEALLRSTLAAADAASISLDYGLRITHASKATFQDDHFTVPPLETQIRITMHDLLKLHAAEQADAELGSDEVQAAQRRLIGYYVETASAGAQLLAHGPVVQPAEDSIARPFTDPASAMAWFDAEHANLLADQQSAQRLGWDDLVHRLACALDPYHRRRGHLESQVTVWRLAVASAQRLTDPAIRPQAHQMLGDAYAQLGKTADALHSLHEALALADHADDSVRGEIHHSLGGAWERHGDGRRALEHAQHALLIFQALDDTYRQARVLNGVGWLQARLGEYAEARANCESALAFLRRLPSRDRAVGESDILDSLGFIAHRMREYDRALDHYRQALAICRTQGHTYLEPDILAHIAETQFAQRGVDQAHDTWRRALELYAAQHRVADALRVQQQLDTLVV